MVFMEGRRRRRPLTRDQLLGIANYLTYSRIAMVPVVVLLMMGIDDTEPIRHALNVILSWCAMGAFTLAGLSDAVDGYYARKYGVVSSFGKFLDPLADKLLSMSALIMLLALQRIAPWIVILLVCRDVTITALRSMAADEGIVLSASDWGKRKTFLQSFAIGFLLVHYPVGPLKIQLIGEALVWLTLVISLGSGLHYIWAFFGEVLEKKKGRGGP